MKLAALHCLSEGAHNGLTVGPSKHQQRILHGPRQTGSSVSSSFSTDCDNHVGVARRIFRQSDTQKIARTVLIGLEGDIGFRISVRGCVLGRRESGSTANDQRR